MDKMDEQILAVERSFLFENEELTFQGLLTDKDKVKYLTKKFDKYIEVRRGDAEVDSQWKQPIPYAIIRRGEEVFLYKRLKKGGEERLHDRLSIGVGGHMNQVNDVRNWQSNLMINLYRELGEELDIKVSQRHAIEPTVIGLINADNDPDGAGLYHIGILAVLDLPEGSEVEVRETEQLEGYWVRSKDLTKSGLYEALEAWSKIAVEAL